MSGWDEGQIFVSDASQVEDAGDVSDSLIKQQFADFLRDFCLDSFIYRDQLRQRLGLGQRFIEVNLEHLRTFNERLANKLVQEPAHVIPLFEDAALEVGRPLSPDDVELSDFQIILLCEEKICTIRQLTSTHISRLVCVPGIVINTSRLQSKATSATIMCRNCHATKVLRPTPGFSNLAVPKFCEGPQTQAASALNTRCPPDPFVVIPDKGKYVDHQTLKLQENPETVPTGEMPRHMLATCERALVGRVVPGTRVTLVGVYTIYESTTKKEMGARSVRNTYMRVVGIIRDTVAGRASMRFDPSEENEFLELSRRPDLYELLSASMAPAIFGFEDIKKAVCCLLFGGSRKRLPDGMRLRGDINVLLLGDPGTAKSQMLKFVEKVAPIAVYTSGKGSSAAGLTASVIRDPSTKEFYLEGGAMVLADGGVVCIDEFDKMHTHDRVAIHEAMEQQTISIAKAGITTVLNSRTSVLAAANPVFGSYDDLKSAEDNIDFQATILSRFDLIFLVKDARNEARDSALAGHVVDLHIRRTTETSAVELPLEFLKRYITYCRMKCAPRLSDEAAEKLKNFYVSIRSTMRARIADGLGGSIPITVRQLEAITRLSESLAKMQLSPVVTDTHVVEAMRLFKVSTMDAATSGRMQMETLTPELQAEIQTVETKLRRRLPIGSTVPVKYLLDDFMKQGLSENSIQRAIVGMVRCEELHYRNRRQRVFRNR